MHLAPHGSAIYGLDQGLEGRLPFGIDVQKQGHPVDFNLLRRHEPTRPIPPANG